MKSTRLSSLSLLLSGIAQSRVITPRQAGFDLECDGEHYPNVADCDAIYAASFSGDTLTISGNDQSNCEVAITWTDLSYVITGNQISEGINAVSTTCFPTSTGGTAVDVGRRYSISIRNNPKYNPKPSNSKRADGDTSFEYGVHTIHAKPASMRHDVGDGLPGGSTWQWDQSQSVTDHVGFSASISATIEEVVGASLSTDVSEDTTYTSGSSVSIPINCENNEYGQVYFQGYAEVWQGTLHPSGDALVVTKPMTNSDGTTAGFYGYDCIST